MKHAGETALRALAPLVDALLHFHEDAAGLFADLKKGSEWQRLPVNSAAERERLLMHVRRAP
jgi:hypothetical protein